MEGGQTEGSHPSPSFDATSYNQVSVTRLANGKLKASKSVNAW